MNIDKLGAFNAILYVGLKTGRNVPGVIWDAYLYAENKLTMSMIQQLLLAIILENTMTQEVYDYIISVTTNKAKPLKKPKQLGEGEKK
jgi:hypothetical protein